jgi:hypothetical protein
MMHAFIAGLGLWTPQFPNLAAWTAGTPDPTATAPAAKLLPARLGRRSSLLTRIAAEVLEQAAAGAPCNTTPAVYATAFGETQTLCAILDSMFTDGSVSPARFHHSVHNTAGGLLSIATVNRAFSTTLSAGQSTVAMALLEGFALLQQRGGEVFVVIAEESPPEPFAQEGFAPAGAALRLSATELPGAQRVSLRRDDSALLLEPRGELRNNPIARSLPLVEALHLRRAGLFGLGAAGWALEADPVTRSA